VSHYTVSTEGHTLIRQLDPHLSGGKKQNDKSTGDKSPIGGGDHVYLEPRGVLNKVDHCSHTTPYENVTQMKMLLYDRLYLMFAVWGSVSKLVLSIHRHSNGALNLSL
jgi:hypothetical protein